MGQTSPGLPRVSEAKLALGPTIETVDHLLDVLDPTRTGGAQQRRADGLDPGGGGGGTPPSHSLEGGPGAVSVGGVGGGGDGGGGVRGEPGGLDPLQAGSGRGEAGVGRGQEGVVLGGQGELGLQHQGGGEAGGQEVLVEAQVRRVDRRGRGGGHWALGAPTARLLLLDEGAHVEWSGGLEEV